MRKLSRSFGELKSEYDVVIVGSGYGGSIAASRFARMGLKVCLLEKGKEFQPGDYPDSLAEATKEMQINLDKRVAKKNGLYDFHVSEDITVFKGCGLGGTSLVNANVSIRPEDRVFEDQRWPSAIRNDMASLDEGYALAKKNLSPTPYPANTPGYPVLPKSKAMEQSAKAMNQPFRYTDINVTFKDGPNGVGYEQKKCINCGDCVTGCNHSAKNTLIMNYLPDAANHGAEIFCNMDVSYIERIGDKWLVYYDEFNADREKFGAPLMYVRADIVVVSGGALGSTEILMRSKEKGLSTSSLLGKHFTGNGDVLGFAYNCDEKINGIGFGKKTEEIDPVGPCITSIIDMRNQPNLKEGITFEEGSIPGPIATAVNQIMLSLAGISGVDTDSGFIDKIKEKKRELESLLRGPYHGATNHMQTYLIMSHDDGNGTMALKEDKLDISWPKVGEQPIFQKASDAMFNATKALGGTYIKNVVWSELLKYKLVTVHPLGGCGMGEDAHSGVTDHTGNVFTGNGNETHQGLYVLDGSILPIPLGTNPLYTISAISERACKLIGKKIGKEINYQDVPLHLPDVKPVPAVQFTETMKGFFSKTEKEDFTSGYQKGEQESSPFLFTLTIKTGDINGFIADPDHKGTMAGSVLAPALSEKPLVASDGLFNLFVKEPTNPKQLRMKYNMLLTSYDGKKYYFSGYKKVEDDKGFDVWQDTTVLFITIYNGTNTDAPVLGKGILKIAAPDFATQMTTMKAVDCKNLSEKLNAIKIFSTFFGKSVLETYFSSFF